MPIPARSITPAACHVVLVTPYYWPIQCAATHLMKALYEGLAADGRRVTVLTNAPRSKELQPPDEERPGGRIIRAWNPFLRRLGVLSKLCEYLWFTAFFLFRGLGLRRIDVLFVPSNPPLAGLPAVLLARLKGAKLIYNLHDIFPDSAVAAGMLPGDGLLCRVLRRAEEATYRVSDRVATISPTFSDHVRGLAPNTPVATIPNWVDTDVIRPLPKSENRFLDECLPRDKFIVLFAGNIGFLQNLDVVVEAAQRVQDSPDIQFVFVGEGNARRSLEERVQELGLSNCSFLPLQPLDRVREVYSACDVGVIPLKPGVAMIAVPSKTWNYMACAKPVIGCIEEDSPLAITIAESRAGLVVPPRDPARLAQAVLQYRNSPDRAAEDGNRGRRYVEEHLSRTIAIAQYVALIHETLAPAHGEA